MENEKRNKVAVLIDCENIHPSQIGKIIETAEAYGQVSVPRGYADWGGAVSREWKNVCARWAIRAVHCFQYRAGKNSSDIQLAVDAMDVLHNQEADVICIASTDSDYANLAIRLRQGGLKVVGIGMENAVDGWKEACTAWVPLPALHPKPAPAPEKPPKPAESPAEKLEKAVRKTIGEILSSQKELEIGKLQTMVTAKHPEFKPELFGWRRFRTVLAHWGIPAVRKGNLWYAQGTAKDTDRLKEALTEAIRNNPSHRLLLSQVCPTLVKADQDFSLAKYGKKKAKDLVQEMGFLVSGSGTGQYVTI